MKAFINKSDEKLETQGTAIREQGTTIRNLERQIGQLATLLSERASGTLSAVTEKNPKETIKFVSPRSWKTLAEPKAKPRDEKEINSTKIAEEQKIGGSLPNENVSNKDVDKQKVNNAVEESKHMPLFPFPQKKKLEKLDKCLWKFLEMLKQLYVNIPFTEVLTQMPAYAKFLTEILSSERNPEEAKVVKLNAHCSAILQNKIPKKCGGPGSFTIPYSLGSKNFDKALCDSGASINLMPLSVFKKLEGELGVIKYMSVSLQLADQTMIIPEGIIEDILVRVDKFIFLVDFIVVDMEVNKEIPLILGRPFLCIGRAFLDIYEEQLMLRVGNEKVVCGGELAEQHKLDKLVGDSLERCISQSSTTEDEDPEIKKEVEALEDENQVVDEEEFEKEKSKMKLELKVLPTHLKYAFLETNNFPVIVAVDLTGEQEHMLIELLREHKKAIGWSIDDIQGINPTIYMHKILLEEGSKPMVQPKRKLNKNLEEVVQKDILKLLDVGITLSISDSQWISPVQVVLKKWGMTVVQDEDNELIPTRKVTKWRMCTDYRRLNDATRKDHFPLPYIDQIYSCG
uniref:Aspartic peptidase DDI1-type domain-containing protein n=1 Tax=Nicotiana tabacum TaxID=4097 RepID=A0A1S4AZ98_TOBAC|nr:PREDICTED: uncharacterized protein LOC107802829 [Nicotiana tabacum]